MTTDPQDAVYATRLYLNKRGMAHHLMSAPAPQYWEGQITVPQLSDPVVVANTRCAALLRTRSLNAMCAMLCVLQIPHSSLSRHVPCLDEIDTPTKQNCGRREHDIISFVGSPLWRKCTNVSLYKGLQYTVCRETTVSSHLLKSGETT
jgi:hypothetical protein